MRLWDGIAVSTRRHQEGSFPSDLFPPHYAWPTLTPLPKVGSGGFCWLHLPPHGSEDLAVSDSKPRLMPGSLVSRHRAGLQKLVR